MHTGVKRLAWSPRIQVKSDRAVYTVISVEMKADEPAGTQW